MSRVKPSGTERVGGDALARGNFTEEQLKIILEFAAQTVAAVETSRADTEALRETDDQVALHLLPEDRNFRVIKIGGFNGIPRLSTFGDREIPERLRSR